MNQTPCIWCGASQPLDRQGGLSFCFFLYLLWNQTHCALLYLQSPSSVPGLPLTRAYTACAGMAAHELLILFRVIVAFLASERFSYEDTMKVKQVWKHAFLMFNTLWTYFFSHHTIFNFLLYFFLLTWGLKFYFNVCFRDLNHCLKLRVCILSIYL